MSWLGSALRSGCGLAARYRWLYAVPVATLLLPAVLYAVRLPDTYESRAVVRARELTGGDGGGALPTEQGQVAYATVSTSQERLLTVENLNAVLPILVPNAAPDDAMARERMLTRIEFDRQSDFAFAVTIGDTDPLRASEAVNTLLRSFLENERAPLLRRARDRRTFYADEAARAAQAHEAARATLAEVRQANAESLPDAKDALGTEIVGLRAEIAMHEQVAGAARRRVEALSDQMTRASRAGAVPVEARDPSAQERQLEHQLSEQQRLLDDARKRLAEARTRYTDKMPAVMALRTEVAGLEQSVNQTVRSLADAQTRAGAAARAQREQRQRQSSEELAELRSQAVREADEATAAAAEVRTRVRELELRMARIPMTTATLVPAQRAVEEAEKRYAALQLAADHAAEREAFYERGNAEDVTSFVVAEWASPAATPTGPRRMAWIVSAIALGMLIGYFLTVLRRHFAEDKVFSVAQLTRLVPGAVIVSVPRLPDGRGRLSRVWRELGPLTWTTACLTLSVLAVAAHKGWIDGPAWLEVLIGRSA